MKTKIGYTLLVLGPLLIAFGINLIFGLTGFLIALGACAVVYGVVLVADFE